MKKIKNKILSGFSLSLILNSALLAQTTSYNTNNLFMGGIDNSAFGWNALSGTNATGCVAIGKGALSNGNSGQYNAAFGTNALYSNTSGFYNTAVGASALSSNLGGSYNTASGLFSLFSNNNGLYNVANGYRALYSNDSGIDNVAIGTEALFSNTGNSANYNVATGYRAMFSNSSGADNTATGHNALYSNVGGNFNTAHGGFAAYNNINGNQNTADGYNALFYNTSGSSNSATGSAALLANTTGSYNTAHGVSSLYSNTSGGYNTSIGFLSMPAVVAGSYNTGAGMFSLNSFDGNYNSAFGYGATTSGNYVNATAIGNGAIAPANNNVRIGNNSPLLWISSAAGWGVASDGRFKEKVTENVPGLAFITKLRPVTYIFNNKKLDEHMMQDMPDSIKSKLMANTDYDAANTIIKTGFIAQEVEKTAKEIGYQFDGVNAPRNKTDHYSLVYAEFVVPLVKGMQEQQQMIELQNQTIKEQQLQIDELKTLVNSLTGNTNALNKTSSITSIPVQISNQNVIVLNRNVPNPFAESTVISYNIPFDFAKAQIIFTTTDGIVIKTMDITMKGAGSLNVFSNDLSHGIYSYSLVVDGKIIDTKKMVKD